ncbi:thiopeptide-type bacteriocin biosynthesis protein [Plantactinospora sp. ZYX-F-223]|uniref:thiopeptide-type bacteriocin biosynthesis protein n=1 Tax=Plantactinospora sp. ZYX-F-223 TaxID=3144103 RepID=UPI0031FDD3E9
MAALVEAVIWGTSAEAAAAEAGIDMHDLADAVQTYKAAGLAALQREYAGIWYHALVRPVDWTTADASFRAKVAPRLDRLDGDGTVWWFLRKHPFWRIRVRTTDHDAASALLDELAAAGVIAEWRAGIYEPETAAFGGDTPMAIVHELFCADSRGVLHYTGTGPRSTGRREVSLLLIRALQHGAGLDWFEAADVFDQVAQMRPAPPAADATRVQRLADQMRPLLALPADARTALFAPDGPLTSANDWHLAFMRAGEQCAEAARAGHLRRGVRAVLAQIVIFHWNRLDLPAHTQAILARAATTAILPGS